MNGSILALALVVAVGMAVALAAGSTAVDRASRSSREHRAEHDADAGDSHPPSAA